MQKLGEQRQLVAWVLAVLALIAVAWSGSLGAVPIFDDYHSIFDNPAVRSISNTGRFFVDPSSVSLLPARAYRPVTLTSYAATFSFLGGSPRAFHLGNLLIHAACTAMLFVLLRVLLERIPCARPDAWAAVGAGLFGIHPGAGQVVHYISSRSESLALAGITGAMLCHALNITQARSRRARIGWSLLTLLSVAFALGSKETGILSLPALVALDLALTRDGPGRGASPRAARLAGPTLLIAVYSWWWLAPRLFAKVGGSEAIPGALRQSGGSMEGFRACLVYFRLTLFPADLAFWRELEPASHPGLEAAIAGIVLTVVISASAIMLLSSRYKSRLLGLGGCLYALPMLPYLVTPGYLVVNENRLYPPLVGVAVLAAVSISGIGTSRTRRTAIVTCALLATLAIYKDRSVSSTWSTEERAWTNAIAVSPWSGDIRAGLGTAYMREGRFEEARRQFRSVLEYPVEQLDAVYDNLGIASYWLGEKDLAYEYFLEAYGVNPGSAEVLNNLGSVLGERGRQQEGLSLLEEAIIIAPGFCEPHLEGLTLAEKTNVSPKEMMHRLRRVPAHCRADPRVPTAEAWLRERVDGKEH